MTDEEKAERKWDELSYKYVRIEDMPCRIIKDDIVKAYLDGLAEGRKESEKDLQTAIKANNAWLKKDTALEEENERLKELTFKLQCCGNCKNCKTDEDGILSCRVKKCHWEIGAYYDSISRKNNNDGK